MTDPTPEAYEAAASAQALRRVPEPNMSADELTTFVRKYLIDDNLRTAVDAVWPIAEREIRAKVAAEIRAADVSDWPGGRWGDVQQCRDRAARIAEGSDTPWPEIPV